MYHKTSNIRRTLVGNKIVYHSDVVGASPVGAAPTTSSFSFKCWDLVLLILETWRYSVADTTRSGLGQTEKEAAGGLESLTHIQGLVSLKNVHDAITSLLANHFIDIG